MFAFAIAGGICGRQNFVLCGKSLALGQLRVGFKRDSSGLFFVRGKSPVMNCRRDYATIIRGGRGDIEPCALRPRPSPSPSAFKSRAIQIQTRGYSQTKPYDIDTNLKNDVILYKYENPKYFKRLNIFGFSQLMFWGYLAHFVFTQLKNIPISQTQGEDLAWWQRINFGEKTSRISLTVFTLLVGYGLLGIVWTYTFKSVRYLILRKGGKDITFVTYTPFGRNKMRTVPLEKMTAKQSREAAAVQLPIKVKGDWMHYLLDMKGEFKHPRLYDFTAGLKRTI